jgi:hypothetical protein
MSRRGDGEQSSAEKRIVGFMENSRHCREETRRGVLPVCGAALAFKEDCTGSSDRYSDKVIQRDTLGVLNPHTSALGRRGSGDAYQVGDLNPLGVERKPTTSSCDAHKIVWR